ncbi:MAG: hypothetical protein KAI24_09935 [Planctomycetes bacterium]|nr:hypothetical protein [Planctomycetota bacterium]
MLFLPDSECDTDPWGASERAIRPGSTQATDVREAGEHSVDVLEALLAVLRDGSRG